MPLIRSTKLNVDLIRNLPEEMKDELVNLDDVIPDGILASLCANDAEYNKKRMDYLNYRPDILDKMLIARDKRRQIDDIDKRIEFETDRKIQFIKDYPQFKPLIESIIYMSRSGNIVKTVPIDQYLDAKAILKQNHADISDKHIANDKTHKLQ